MSKEPDKIAFLQFGAVGDIMFATPALREVSRHAQNQGKKIDWFIRDTFTNLIDTHPLVDEVIPYKLPNIYGQKQRDEGVMWDQMKRDARDLERQGKYMQIYLPQMWPDHNFYRSQRHIVDMMVENITCLGYQLPEGERYLELHSNYEDEFSINKRFPNLDWTKVVTINHISYAASPVWNQDKYKRFATELLDHDLIPMFTGGPNDSMPDVNGALDARCTTYREWRVCIQRSKFWFGLDTGAKGIACTTSTPMLVLQSADFQVHKTGVANYGLCKHPKPIFEVTIPLTIASAIDIILKYGKSS